MQTFQVFWWFGIAIMGFHEIVAAITRFNWIASVWWECETLCVVQAPTIDIDDIVNDEPLAMAVAMTVEIRWRNA